MPKDIEATTRWSVTTQGEAPEAGSLSALTVLHHPDAHRVGERAVLNGLALGQRVELSRRRPAFAAAGSAAGQPLASPYLSRRSLSLEPLSGGGLRLRRDGAPTRVDVDGRPLNGSVEISREELENGVVLELAQKLVLCLHAFTPISVTSARDYGLVGESEAVLRLRRDIGRVLDVPLPVLIRGETGTGKELVAQAIHRHGSRRQGPLLSVNLGSLTPTLAAAELFGSVRGSFTGSVRDQPGYFRQADGGTLFLDEMGEAPPEVQAMLLRVMETGEVQPVGGTRPAKVDVRLLAATDAALEARADQGDFREPLIHRLSGYVIWIEPLRRRRDDIGLLLQALAEQEVSAWRLEARADELPVPRFAAPLVARLARYDWPGNVRQLRNVVRQLVVAHRGEDILGLGPEVDRLLPDRSAAPESAAGEVPSGALRGPRRRRKPAEVAEEELLAALRAHRYALQPTARHLGISRASLYVRIRASSRARTAGDLESQEILESHRRCAGDVEAMVEELEVSAVALRRRLRELGQI